MKPLFAYITTRPGCADDTRWSCCGARRSDANGIEKDCECPRVPAVLIRCDFPEASYPGLGSRRLAYPTRSCAVDGRVRSFPGVLLVSMTTLRHRPFPGSHQRPPYVPDGGHRYGCSSLTAGARSLAVSRAPFVCGHFPAAHDHVSRLPQTRRFSSLNQATTGRSDRRQVRRSRDVTTTPTYVRRIRRVRMVDVTNPRAGLPSVGASFSVTGTNVASIRA